MTKVDFNLIQQAFIDGHISIENLVEILIDNFGQKRATQILMFNLHLALQKENAQSIAKLTNN